MWSTSQKIKFFYTILLIWTINFFAHAQNTESTCMTCGWPAIEITNFINLANQIIDTIPNNSTLQAQWAQYNVFWPRQWWVYNGMLWNINPWSLLGNIVAWTLKNFDKRQSYIRATLELLGIYGIDIIKDGWLWFIVSTQPWPIVRDYQLLLDIDTLVWDKLYEIGIAWWYGKSLPDNQLEQIKKLIKDNSGVWKLLATNPKIDESLTSTQSLALLLRINNRLKKILVLWGNIDDNTISVWWSSKTTIILNEDYFSSITERYKCTRIWFSGKSCSSNFATFKKNINSITETFKEKWPKESREKIETASKRLTTRALQVTNQIDWNFYQENITEYSQREAELLSIQWATKRTWLWIITGAISSNIPREISNTRADIAWAREHLKNTSLSGSSYMRTIFNQNDTNTNNNIEYPPSPQQINISNSLQDIVTEHQSVLITQINNTTSDTQEALSKTLFHIRIINNILYNNIKEDIARTCELQCSNLWWICR